MYNLIDNKEKNQYEIHIDGHLAKIEYKLKGDRIYLIHTEVPKELGGRGIGSQIVKSVLEDIKTRGLVLVPLCPFVKAYMERHPEWNELVDQK